MSDSITVSRKFLSGIRATLMDAQCLTAVDELDDVLANSPERNAEVIPSDGLDSSDRERLMFVARVLRGVADFGPGIPIGNLWYAVMQASGAVKRVLDLSDKDVHELNDPELIAMADDVKAALKRYFRASAIDSKDFRKTVLEWVDSGAVCKDCAEWEKVVNVLAAGLERFSVPWTPGVSMTVGDFNREIAALALPEEI